MDGFFSSEFFSDFFDIGTITSPQTGGGGWGAFMPAYQKETDDDEILLAWFMLMRQPYG